MLLTDEEIQKIEEASYICGTARADFVVDCDINSLYDAHVLKLLQKTDYVGALLNSIMAKYYFGNGLAS